MRLLFLSDTHLGLDLPARPRVERRRRGADLFEAFERALGPALRGEVDAVLHGGDLHFRSRVPAWLAEAAIAPLRAVAERGVPVLLVPGNHERSRLPYPLLARHERLHVLDRPRTVHLEAGGVRVAFAGFPYAPEVRDRFPALLAATGWREGEADHRVLCLHQCVEGATCGPGDFTFRGAPDVVRRADLPPGLALVLCGHVHRAQRLVAGGAPPVIYAGSTERTSFAEAGEQKGTVRITFGRGEATAVFSPLPTRPMVIRTLSLGGRGAGAVHGEVARALAGTPADALVQLRLQGLPDDAQAAALAAPSLRQLAGGRLVSVAWPRATPSGSRTA